ncbi:MAG: class I SAM-dependent methyltransferase [Anaerolineae bacterium]
MTARAYHLQELEIARSPADPRRVMPVILPRHRRILDIGAGAGQTLIASELTAEVLAVGVDVDQAALRLGRELTQQIAFSAAQAEALPFADATFDLVLARVSLPWTNLPAAVQELGRVTQAGGDVWLVLHSLRKTMRDLADNLRRGQAKHALYRSYVLANGLTWHLTGHLVRNPFSAHERYESFQTVTAMRRALAAAGFVDLVVQQNPHFVITARKA